MSKQTKKQKSDTDDSDQCTSKQNSIHFHPLTSNSQKKLVFCEELKSMDIPIFDRLFNNNEILNNELEDFDSFKNLIKQTINKYNPNIIKETINDINKIKKEGKFSLNETNLTTIYIPTKILSKKTDISINSRVVKFYEKKIIGLRMTLDNIIYYFKKAIFSQKHCFEIEIKNNFKDQAYIGLISLKYSKKYINTMEDLFRSLGRDNEEMDFISLSQNFFYTNDSKKEINKYLKYGDVVGIGFDLNINYIYIFINGELVMRNILNIKKGENTAYMPFISVKSYNDLIINFGEEKLKYNDNYLKYNLIPLDEPKKNYLVLSNLKTVTDDLFNILLKNGISLINNKYFFFSDINILYYDIFNFLSNISLNKSYLINLCLLKIYFSEIFQNKPVSKDIFIIKYLPLQFILNSSDDKEKIAFKILLNITEEIHLKLLGGKLETIQIIHNLFELLRFLLSKDLFKKVIFNLDDAGNRIFSIFLSVFKIEINNKYLSEQFDFIGYDNNNSLNDCSKNLTGFNYFENKLNKINELIIDKKNIINSYYDKTNFFSGIIKEIYLDEINNINIGNETLYKHFQYFLRNVIRSHKNEQHFSCVFKNFFIPAMLYFNIEYPKIKNDISIRSYLSKYDIIDKKLGGSQSEVHKKFVPIIENFDMFLNKNINTIQNLFLLDFIELLFCNNNSKVWDSSLKMIIFCFRSSDTLLETCKKKHYNISYKESQTIIMNFLCYQLNYLSTKDCLILLEFFANFSGFILDYLYPKKLIYFLPEKFLFNLTDVLNFISTLATESKKTLIQNNKSTTINEEINNDIKKINSLIINVLKNYIKIACKLLNDKNINLTQNKIYCISFISTLLHNEEYFDDEEIYIIFDVLLSLNNEPKFKEISMKIMEIFVFDIEKKSKLTSLGEKLSTLMAKNQQFLRNILLIISKDMHEFLTNIQQCFSEYKFIPKNINKKNNNNIRTRNNNNNSVTNNNNRNNISRYNPFNPINNIPESISLSDIDDDSIDDIVDNYPVNNQIISRRNNINYNMHPFQTLFSVFQTSAQNPLTNVLFGTSNYQRRPGIIIVRDRSADRSLNVISDNARKELALIKAFEDKNKNFIKLKNFVKLIKPGSSIFDKNSFEYQTFIQLLISIYYSIFLPKNTIKLDTDNIITPYKKLLNSVRDFYFSFFLNIVEKNQQFKNEIAKQRNILHFDDIIKCFEKFKGPFFKEFVDYFKKLLKDFIELVPDEKIIEENNKIQNEKNICCICYNAQNNVHLLPCQHICCKNCAIKLKSNNIKKCPFCNVCMTGIKEDSSIVF